MTEQLLLDLNVCAVFIQQGRVGVPKGMPAETIDSNLPACDVNGVFCTNGSEREFTLEERWYADEEV